MLPLSCVRAAGDDVTYILTASNTGAVRLKNLVMTIPAWASLVNCTPSTAAWPGPWALEVHKNLVCYAHYTFTQDFYEVGLLSFVATGKPNELPAAVESAAADVTPTYSASLTYHEGPCVLPDAARECHVTSVFRAEPGTIPQPVAHMFMPHS
jgi:hypothetical protein